MQSHRARETHLFQSGGACFRGCWCAVVVLDTVPEGSKRGSEMELVRAGNSSICALHCALQVEELKVVGQMGGGGAGIAQLALQPNAALHQ